MPRLGSGGWKLKPGGDLTSGDGVNRVGQLSRKAWRASPGGDRLLGDSGLKTVCYRELTTISSRRFPKVCDNTKKGAHRQLDGALPP
jgi:hypothetical protein